MKNRQRPAPARRLRPHLELLESRLVPALNAFQDVNGDLYLSEDTANSNNSLEVDVVADGTVSYSYGGGPFSANIAGVRNLYIVLLTASADREVDLEVNDGVNGHELLGDVFIWMGDSTAFNDVDVNVNNDPPGSIINGNLNIHTGNALGDSDVLVEDNVAVNGNVYVDGGVGGTDFVTLDNNNTHGSVAVYRGNDVEVDSTIDGSLTVSSTNPAVNPFNPLTIKTSAVTSFPLTNPAGLDSGDVGLDIHETTVGAGLSVTTSQGDDFVDLHQGTVIRGNANLNLGNGNNEMLLSSTSAVVGNLAVVAGNGDDSVGLNGAMLGNLYVNLGKADTTTGNILRFGDFGSTPLVLGNSISYIGGAGRNTLIINGLTAPGARFTALFGAGPDIVLLNAGNTILASAFFDGGFGPNQFHSIGVIHFPFMRLHF